MQCPRCQHENPTGHKFCGECGAPLAAACPACGASNTPGQKFCGECGTSLTDAARPRKFGSPETYTPKHLAEKILTSKSALEGERKQVTVLFADLTGSTELIADRDPEEARKLLDPVLDIMMEAVHRYEGIVNQFMGDGIMAIFGAPLAHEDHAVRACYAGLAMQSAIRRHSEEARRSQGVTLQIRVGLNSGDVLVGTIGTDLRMDYRAVGQTTHLAARMEQLAAPGSILLTADTFRLAEGFVQVTPLGPVPVKGVSEPVEVFEVSGAVPVRTRLQAAAARGLTRFVGRQEELAVLHLALERAASGHGQLVALVGEPGVGKSRLVWEFTHSHRAGGWLILESGSASYGKATPYLPVIDLLKGYCQIEGRDDGRRVREKVTGKLLALDRALEPILPALLALLDIPVEDPAWQALDPLQRRRRTLDAVKHLLLRESQVQPLLLVFEDLHWIDLETQALLDSLIDSLPAARVLLLVNYRPEYQHAWGSKTYYTQLRIDPLPPENVQELLQVLLGASGGLQPVEELLIAQTEGNPFFLEESVRTLVETKALAGERGAYRLAKPVQNIQVPATVQAVLAARIDRLPPAEKRLLQAAAVIGEEIPFPVLQSIAEEPEEAVRHGLMHLQAAEFVYETSLFPDLEYTFKHGLTYQVAYGSLLQERRRTLHARIVEVIERLYPDRLAEHVERLAHHAIRGELWEKAVTYLEHAGAKAIARSANWEAVAYFEQALGALAHLSETGRTLEAAIDLRFALRTALFPLAEFDRGLGCVREAEPLARRLGDQRRLGWASLYMGHSLWITGNLREARDLCENAHAIAETLQEFPLRVAANLYLGVAHFSSGDHRQAGDFFAQTLLLLGSDRWRERFSLAGFPAVLAKSYLVQALAERGAFEEGVAHGQEGMRMAEALDHPYSLAMAHWCLVYLYSVKGDHGQSLRLLERGVALSRDWNLLVFSPLFTAFLGTVYALSGDAAEGLSLLTSSLAAQETMQLLLYHSLTLVHLGQGYLLANRFGDALASASRALVHARERGERGYEACALRLLGEIAAQQDPRDVAKAEENYQQAMALAKELGMRPLQAHCYLGLGKLHQSTGRGERARAHLATAKTMYSEMDMGYWLAQAE